MGLFTSPVVRAADANNNSLSGAKWHFYLTGTLTPADVYSSSDLSVAHANPVVADAGGLFAPIYLDPSLIYRAVLKTAAGTTVQDIDPLSLGVDSRMVISAVSYGAREGAEHATATTTALNAANDAAAAIEAASGYGAVVTLPRGNWYIDGLVYFNRMVDFQCAGKFATRIHTAAAGARLQFGPRATDTDQDGFGGLSGGFRLDGNSIGTELMVVGRSVARRFADIDIRESADRGLVLEETQNCTFLNVDVTLSAGDGVTLDYGAGGNIFTKCEFNLNGRTNLCVKQTGSLSRGYSHPQHNKFDVCLFEGTQSTSVACVEHANGAMTVFDTCIMTLLSSHYAYGTNIPVFWMRRVNTASGVLSHRVSFEGACSINGSTSGGLFLGKGILVENSPGAGTGENIYLGDNVLIQLCDTAIEANAASRINGSPVIASVTNRFVVTGAPPGISEGDIMRKEAGHTHLTGTDPATPVEIITMASGQTANAYEIIDSAGTLRFSVSPVGSVFSDNSLNANVLIAESLVQTLSRGTVAAPAYTFVNDLDCGLWSRTTNEINFSVGGAEALRINTDHALCFIPFRVANYTVATLPTPSASLVGAVARASDARNEGEGAGAGTGSLVECTGSIWKIPGTPGAVAA